LDDALEHWVRGWKIPLFCDKDYSRRGWGWSGNTWIRQGGRCDSIYHPRYNKKDSKFYFQRSMLVVMWF